MANMLNRADKRAPCGCCNLYHCHSGRAYEKRVTEDEIQTELNGLIDDRIEWLMSDF